MKHEIVNLSIDEMPKEWYNIVPDLPEPLPPAKDPEEGPSRIKQLENFYTKTSLELDASKERWIKIPEEVWELYVHVGRPRPLQRALRLERYLKTPARIYFKREDLSPTGSFKMNTTLAQAYFAAKEGVSRLAVETGAGQTGTAFAFSSKIFGLQCTIYFVRFAYNLKPDRATYMKMLGAEVLSSPTDRTEIGRTFLKKDPKHPGSIGIATAESLQDAASRDDTVATVGSSKNHVLLTQSIIGLETKKQLDSIDEKPDVMISCIGGGSNFYGFICAYLKERLDGRLKTVRFLGAESGASPRLTKGEYRYDFTEPSKSTPMAKVYTLGVDASLPLIRAEGIRSSSTAPILSLLRSKGMIDTRVYAIDEKDVFEAARTFLQVEGFLVAPESAYAVRAAIDEALEAKKKNEEKVIVFNVSGMGHVDFQGYREVLKDI
ncbi:TrpB-like pyridoxal phosphate-dependent enzyme [Candidatus Bathyarchaeota archaeon]|jgi:tryptophan synthase beta chain|nr:TrpB-like pyridoxal phosphate-dependent enzyme [Candidatus Bathyarchaeota archaeon]